MKSTGIINTTALFLLLGVATPAIASQAGADDVNGF